MFAFVFKMVNFHFSFGKHLFIRVRLLVAIYFRFPKGILRLTRLDAMTEAADFVDGELQA